MKEFLLKVLGICVLLSLFNLAYLFLAGASILAIVLNSYLETKDKKLSDEAEKVQKLAQDLKETIRHLESEQNVLRMKVQNLANPGRKL